MSVLSTFSLNKVTITYCAWYLTVSCLFVFQCLMWEDIPSGWFIKGSRELWFVHCKVDSCRRWEWFGWQLADWDSYCEDDLTVLLKAPSLVRAETTQPTHSLMMKHRSASTKWEASKRHPKVLAKLKPCFFCLMYKSIGHQQGVTISVCHRIPSVSVSPWKAPLLLFCLGGSSLCNICLCPHERPLCCSSALVDHLYVTSVSVSPWKAPLLLFCLGGSSLCRPVYFYAFGVKCTLWRPFLRFYAWAARFYAFRRQSPTLGYLRSICVISLSVKTVTEWCTWKTRFGWLPVMQDPINFKLTRTSARTWIFSLATAFSVVEVPFLCGFSMMSSKRNHETGSCDRRAGVWKKKRCHQVGSILRSSRSSDLRDKGRSTLSVLRVKLIFSPQIIETRTTLHRTSYRKRALKHTQTHAHTQGCQLLRFGSLINLCYCRNGATLRPVKTVLRSRQVGYGHFKKNISIFISFLALRR